MKLRVAALSFFLAALAVAGPQLVGSVIRFHNTTTADRPSAVTSGTGGVVYDGDAGHLVTSNGADWVTPGHAATAVPSVPTGLAVTADNAVVTATWNRVAMTNDEIPWYVVTSTPETNLGITTNDGTAQVDVSYLTNGVAYTFKVKACNSFGCSAESAASASVTPSYLPGPPRSVNADGGPLSMDMTWTAPEDAGGAPILSYLIYIDGGIVADAGNVLATTVWGLPCGTEYKLDVVAQNLRGKSSPGSSGPSFTGSCGANIYMQAFVDGGAGLPVTSMNGCQYLSAGQDAGCWGCIYRQGAYMEKEGGCGYRGQWSYSNYPLFCPDGPNCCGNDGDEVINRTGAGVGAVSGDNDYTYCAYATSIAQSDQQVHMVYYFKCDDGEGAWDENLIGVGTPGIPHASGYSSTVAPVISTGISGARPLANASVTLGAPHLLCATYAAATTQCRVYVDGVDQTVDAGCGPIGSLTEVPPCWREMPNSIYVAKKWEFQTEKVLTGAQISAIATSVILPLKTVDGTNITFTRASEASCFVGNRTASTHAQLGWVAPNRPCVTQPVGFGTGAALSLRPASTNYAVKNYHQLATNGYTKTGTIAVTNVQGVDLPSTAFGLNGSTSGAKMTTTTGVTINATQLVVSAWVKAASGTPSVDLRLVDATAASTVCTATATTSSDWTRLSCTASTTSGNSFKLEMYPGGTGGTGNTNWFCPMIEVGNTPSADCIRAGAAAATRAAETATVPTPTITNKNQFCMSATAKPVNDNWDAGAPRGILSIGTYSGANRAFLYVNEAKKLIFDLFDNSNASQQVTSADALDAGMQYVSGCTDGGFLFLKQDTIVLGGYDAGTGTGVLTTPAATMYLGGETSGTNATFNGYVGNICLGDHAGCDPTFGADAGVSAVLSAQAFVDGGVGLATVAADFCNLLTAGMDAGTWGCTKADGGVNGSYFTAAAPTTASTSRIVCPNGAACDTRLATTQLGIRTVAATISTFPKLTECLISRSAKDTASAVSYHDFYQAEEGHWEGTGQFQCVGDCCGNCAPNDCGSCDCYFESCYPEEISNWVIDVPEIAHFIWYPGATGITSNHASITNLPSLVYGARQLTCARYVTDGGVDLFVDGALVADAGAGSTLAAPRSYTPNNGMFAPYATTGTGFEGQFFTQTDLSSTQISTIARAILADQVTTTAGSAITFLRSSEASCLAPNGTQVWLPPNRPCITQPSGFGTGGALAIRPASTNYAIKNYYQALTGGYTATDASQTYGWASVDDLDSAHLITAESNGGKWATTTGIAITAANLVVSAWVKHTSSTQTVDLRLVDSTGASTVCTANATATTSWQQIQCTASVTSGHNFKLEMYPGGLSGTGTTVWFCPMIEVGTVASDSCIRAGASAATRAAESATFPLPALSSNSTYCLKARGSTPLVGGLQADLLSIGPGTGANQAKLYFTSAGKLAFDTYDSANHALTWLSTSAVDGGSRLAGCSTGGVLSGSYDGVTAAGATSGTGAGVFGTPNGTVYLGGNNSNYIGEIVIGNKLGVPQ